MCGIFGQINTESSTFNRIAFNTLGIANDSRGGDSCGIFIDGKVEYGVGKEKFYSNFFLKSDLLKTTTKCKVAFGHCRKTSVGKTSLETAQPVVIKEGDEIKYVLLHNGTIYNYEELAKKYIPDIDIKGMSDSQVMARIFYYKGYDALSEYNGGAVFAIADYRENKDNPRIFFWKGESKQSTYQTAVSEERPFYYIPCKNKIFFSSISTYLEGFVNETCWTIHPNALIECINGDLFIVKEYSRSKAQQLKEYTRTTTTNTNSNSNSSHDSGWAHTNYYIHHNKYGEYLFKKERIHGKKFCSAYGTCVDQEYQSTQAMFLYFYNGILLYNKECFDIIEDVRNAFAKIYPEYSDYKLFCEDYPEIPSYFSYTPIKMYEGHDYLEVTEDLMWQKFTGEFTTVLVDYVTKTCENGKTTFTSNKNAAQSFNIFKEKSSKYYINKESFYKLINNTYNVGIQLQN